MSRQTTAQLITALLFFAALNANSQDTDSPELPEGIDPVSYSRLPALSRNQLDAEGQSIYDVIVGDGPQPTTGPVAVTLYSPKVADAFQRLNQYLRYEGVLSPRQYEVAILVASWEIEQQYEWSAHEPAAVRAGVPEVVINTIKYDRVAEGLTEEDTLIIAIGRQLMREHTLDAELFNAATQRWGEQGTVELVTIMGDYVMAGMLMTAIDQQQPPDRPALLPER